MAGLDQGYSEYQPSEIGWLVEVPIDWLLYRMDDLTDTVRIQIDPSALGAMTVTHYSIPSVQEFGMGLIEEGETIDSNNRQDDKQNKSLSSPSDSIGDPCFKSWIPDYHLGNDNIFAGAE